MAQKIFKYSFFYGISILLLCLVVFTSVMYKQMEQRVFSELAIEAEYLAAGLESGGGEYLDEVRAQRRISWVDASGNVIYDSLARPEEMENHLGREEIAEALEKGWGRSKHISGTTTQTTLYYALRMSDGSVIRLAAAQDSLVTMIMELVSPVIWTLLLLSLLCGIVSSRLAKQITAPINSLDLDDPGASNPYRELKPLVRRVWEQNRTIRRQMDELTSRQREFDAITENMSEGLLLVDNRGVIISSNASGMEAVSLSGGDFKAVGRANCIPEVCLGVDEALAGRRYENVLHSENSALQLIVSPVVSSGHVSGAIILVLDVTERVRREELRREFSANVSHELKTPLTSISGFAELMMSGLVPEEKMREFSSDIYSESRRLINLVEDIIRLSRIDEGEEMPESESVDLLALAHETARSLAPAAEKAGVELAVTGERAAVWGCRHILDEMVYNLAENAIKYNRPGGHVEINLAAEGDRSILSVRDDGIGIPPQHQKRIFERFYRVDKSHSKLIGGTGLGLSIVRRGAIFHDAVISLKSEPGKGSEFTIVFPVKER